MALQLNVLGDVGPLRLPGTLDRNREGTGHRVGCFLGVLGPARAAGNLPTP